ncbi:MAG: HAD-IA family hydrolase [Thermoanaerobaculia bacterium]|nr:HAD-IA family hydrolase [Thermoanaerobaculia bacterium]
MQPTPIRSVAAVSFDVTGTLIHCPRLAEIYAEVLGRHGVEVDPERLGELVPIVWKELSCRVVDGRDRFASHPGGDRGFWSEFLGRIAAYLEIAHPGPFAAAELYDRFARADAWELYPDVEPTLDRLASRRLRLVVTSNWDARLPDLLEDLGLARRFEAIVYSWRVGYEKPHPAIFEAVTVELELAPAAVLHIGDRRLADLEGARAAGMRALLLGRDGIDGDLARLDELPTHLSRPGDVLD